MEGAAKEMAEAFSEEVCIMSDARRGFALATLLIVALFIVGCGRSSNDSSSPKALSGVTAFIDGHQEYGKVIGVQAEPDWANGARQQITTTTGSYLFYLYGEDVVGVWRYNAKGGREQIFHKEVPTNQDAGPRPAADDLPAYTVILKVPRADGSGHAVDILVPSLSPATSAAERERVARAIASKEGATALTMYSTEDAYKANVSASFAKEHPAAFKQGYLGELNDQGFMQ